MILHIWLSLLHRNDWILSTVLYRFRLKGHAVRLYTSPQSFSAKIVQVLFHFFNTEETKKKKRWKRQKWIDEVSIYSDGTKHTAEEWQIQSKHCTLTLCYTRGVACTFRTGEHFIFSSSTFRGDSTVAVCAKLFCYQLWNWRITIDEYLPQTSNELQLKRVNDSKQKSLIHVADNGI